MPEKAIDVLVRFARVVSDADAASEVLSFLADALCERVSPAGVAVFSLGADGRLHCASERNLPLAKAIEVDFVELDALGPKIAAASGGKLAAPTTLPLVAAGSLYGAVVMLANDGAQDTDMEMSLARGLVDLAATALGTNAHIEQLQRQFEELSKQHEMLVRTEKLRALGQMAAGVSHDLKNILNPLSLHIQVIARALERGNVDDAKESAAEMKDVLKRGVQTLERLRAFSRQEKEAKSELVELDSLAREAAAIGKSRSGSTGQGRLVRIQEELHSPAPVMAVSGEVVSALVNLIVNAVDAGAKTITLRSGEGDAGCWIEVVDDGPGMPTDVASRVFEPFFTTKGAEGTGLGLAIVYASMQRHGGSVTVQTAEGKGTTFRLWLPYSGPLSTARVPLA